MKLILLAALCLALAPNADAARAAPKAKKPPSRPKQVDSCLNESGWALAACLCVQDPNGSFMGKPCGGQNGWL